MAEPFFVPFKRSHCIFTPELWCDYFNDKAEDGVYNFFCDIIPGTLMAILRPDREADHIGNIYHKIKEIWGGRRVGFQCTQIGADAWILPQPCEACKMARRSQIVILDLDNNASRASSFLALAAKSDELLQQVRLFVAVEETIPWKKLILLNNGQEHIAPHLKAIYPFIDYAEADLSQELSKLVTTTQDFSESSKISISFEEIEGVEESINIIEEESNSDNKPNDTEPQSKPHKSGQVDSPPSDDDEVQIVILDEESITDQPEENPKKIVEEIIDRLHELEPLKDSQIIEQIDGHIQNRRYYKALQLLNSKPSFAVQDWEHYRQSTVWQCLNTMPPIDIVRFFFEMIAPVGRKDMGLEWQSEDPPEGSLTVTDASLQEHLKISPVPVRVYNHLRENHIEECYTYVSGQMNAPEIPILVFRETSDEFPVGLRMLQYREAGQPVVRFIQFKLSALKKRIADRTGLDFFRDQILEHYRMVDDLYREGLTRDVFQDGEFFGRTALIEDLIAHIHSGEKFFISGLRRSGKTSLLRRLQLVNQLPDHLMVYVSFERMGYVPKDKLNEVYLFFLRQLKSALQEKYPPVKYPRDRHPTLDFEQMEVFGFDSKTSLLTITRHFVEDLDRLLSDIQAEDDLRFRKLILLLDEIERLFPDSTRKENADGVEQSEAFLAQLRDLSNSRNGVMSVGMVGFGPVLTLLRDYESPIYDQFEEKPLGMLTREECDELVTTIGSRMLVFYPPESLDAIFQATGGDPQITRYLCSSIFQRRGRKPGSVDVEEVQNGTMKFLKTSKYQTRVADIFRRFEPYFREEAEILRRMACAADVNAFMTFSEIETLYSSESLEVFLEKLCDYGLLRQSEDNRYTISMGLLHQWLHQEYE